jgi:hypothetical protein
VGEWDGKTERRHDNQVMMALLASMDKNLALAVQRLEAQGSTLDKHIVDDKAIQKELADGQIKINNKLSWYAGALAALISICTAVLKWGR